MKLRLNDIHLAIIYILSTCVLIEWSIQLIAPFNALRLVSELNGLIILSDPRLQTSHFIFRILALVVDQGINFATFVQIVQPLLNMSSLLTVGIITITLFHPSETFQNARMSFVWLLGIYFALILLISASISFAFFASSPAQVLLSVNRAGAMGVFGGIGLCVISLFIMSSSLVSGVRQKSSKSV
jgi:hypothetical protein